jgi:hypothetical protein
VEWDITRYAERVPRNPSKPGTKAANDKESALKWRHPPLNGFTASIPCIIVDMQGFILAWYLPGILSDFRQAGLSTLSDCSGKPDGSQNEMLAAREMLGQLLKITPSTPSGSSSRGSWRGKIKYFQPGEDSLGLVNLSPAWFQLGHDVSASSAKIYSFGTSFRDSELGNSATTPAGFCELRLARGIELARCHLRI